jgi:hypothetical protein
MYAVKSASYTGLFISPSGISGLCSTITKTDTAERSISTDRETLQVYNVRSQVSSGSIVSDYGLDDRAIGVRSPAGAKDFSFNLCVNE